MELPEELKPVKPEQLKKEGLVKTKEEAIKPKKAKKKPTKKKTSGKKPQKSAKLSAEKTTKRSGKLNKEKFVAMSDLVESEAKGLQGSKKKTKISAHDTPPEAEISIPLSEIVKPKKKKKKK